MFCGMARLGWHFRPRPPGCPKWTDDQGNCSYSDQMPAEGVNKAACGDRQAGPAGQEIDPLLTPAQAKAKEAEDERLRQIAKGMKKVATGHIALTHSYTSEEEIDFARSRALLASKASSKRPNLLADLTRRSAGLKKDKLGIARSRAAYAR